MKRSLVLLAALALLLTGCGRDAARTAMGETEINNERMVKEFVGTVNIFHRADDELLLSTEEEDYFKYYNIDIGSAQIMDSVLTEVAERFIYFEPVGSKGFIAVEDKDYKNTLIFIGRDNVEKIIEDDIGPAYTINISIAPKAGKIAFTTLIQGSDIYRISIYNIETAEKYKLTTIKSDGFIAGFDYLINWSSNENNVIVQDKYIYDTYRGSQKGEIKSAYSQWSPEGRKIAFLLEEGPEGWLDMTDYYVYPGKKVCVYDILNGSYEEVFEIKGDENIFGDIIWDGKGEKIAFPGIKAGDISLDDWYMRLNYSSIYIVDTVLKKSKRLEINADASDGTMIELGNLKFSDQGGLLSFTVGNYDESNLHIINTTTLEAGTFENAEYLHWIDGENYCISAGNDTMYFSMNNSIIEINKDLEETVKYVSQNKLDDFYLAYDTKGILIFELQDDVHYVRFMENK